MEKKLLIFDADGTLWDSEKDVFLSFNHTLKTLAGFEITKEKFQTLAGMPLGMMFEKVLPENKKSLSDDYEKAYKKYYIDEEHYADATELFPYVKQVLDNFKRDGYHLAIASSKPKRILDKMVTRFKLDGFQFILGTEESTFKHKPDPEIVQYIMNQLTIKKAETVLIGDSQSDILTGKNAGIDTIAVTYGYDSKENLIHANPTSIIGNFCELETLIELK